ncbi:glycerophosphodiester phosphodiesterase family protein [Pseudokineococcus basanitobsidens]|uniref:Glycerophosphodiester phosphodiesterase family protein n=1 Tax=Pseudokineococcus basanitobsidens TaxID=1926649 RepID=A0ABU8RJI8_9ACTN
MTTERRDRPAPAVPTPRPPSRAAAPPGTRSAPGRPGRRPLPLLRRAPGAPPAVVAHRGSSSTAPENTLPALEAARRGGASWVETDLRRTRDGVPVLLHDPRLERTTDGAGELAGTSAADLHRLDAGSWFSPAHAGARVPRLDDLVTWATEHPEMHLLLELKGDWAPADVVPVVEAVRAASLGPRSVLQSFEPTTVAALATAAPDLARGLLVRTGGPVDVGRPSEVEDLVATHDLVAVNPGDRLVAADPGLPARLHHLDVAVWVWTVDDEDRWADLDAAGVDGVITNCPARMLAHLAEGPAAPSPAVAA